MLAIDDFRRLIAVAVTLGSFTTLYADVKLMPLVEREIFVRKVRGNVRIFPEAGGPM
jgi:hypothetical protein